MELQITLLVFSNELVLSSTLVNKLSLDFLSRNLGSNGDWIIFCRCGLLLSRLLLSGLPLAWNAFFSMLL